MPEILDSAVRARTRLKRLSSRRTGGNRGNRDRSIGRGFRGFPSGTQSSGCSAREETQFCSLKAAFRSSDSPTFAHAPAPRTDNI
jgi:hypothetical protein